MTDIRSRAEVTSTTLAPGTVTTPAWFFLISSLGALYC
jgi:hypothetical protein